MLSFAYILTFFFVSITLINYNNQNKRLSKGVKIVYFGFFGILLFLINWFIVQKSPELVDIKAYKVFHHNEYVDYYFNIANSFFHRHGLIWIQINGLFYLLNLETSILYALISVLYYLTSILVIFKYSTNRKVRMYAVVFLFTFRISFYSNEIMRQTLAMIFLNIFIYYILNNRKYFAYLFFCFAVVSHITVLIFLPYILAIRKMYYRKIFPFLIVLSIPFVLMFYKLTLPLLSYVPILGEYLKPYTSEYISKVGGQLLDVISFSTVFLILIFIVISNSTRSVDKFRYGLVYVGTIFAAILAMFTLNYRLLDRLVYYFFIYISLGVALNTVHVRNKYGKFLANLFFVIISILNFCINLYLLLRRDGIIDSII